MGCCPGKYLRVSLGSIPDCPAYSRESGSGSLPSCFGPLSLLLQSRDLCGWSVGKQLQKTQLIWWLCPECQQAWLEVLLAKGHPSLGLCMPPADTCSTAWVTMGKEEWGPVRLLPGLSLATNSLLLKKVSGPWHRRSIYIFWAVM